MRAAAVVLALACAAPAAGADVSGGYSALREGSSTVSGAALGVSWPAGPRWSLAVEASGHSGNSGGEDLREIALVAGPRLVLRREGRLRPFVHASGGVVQARRQVEVFGVAIGPEGVCDGGCPSSTGVLIQGGGGLDVALGDRLSLRLREVDYRWRRVGGTSQGGVRVAAGLVLKLR